MSIVTLPIEVLTRISEATMPEGFENFSLACKTFYAVSAQFCEKHNRFKERYTTFRYDNLLYLDWLEDERAHGVGVFQDKLPVEMHYVKGAAEIFCFSALELLHQISEEPSIARYIADFTTVNDMFGDCTTSEAAKYFKNPFVQDRLKQIASSQNLLILLEDLPYLQDAGADALEVRDYLIWEYSSGIGDDLATALLLTLLPNVTKVKTYTGYYFSRTCDAGIPANFDRILTLYGNLLWRNTQDSKYRGNPSASLQKLECLAIRWFAWEDNSLLECDIFLCLEKLKDYAMGEFDQNRKADTSLEVDEPPELRGPREHSESVALHESFRNENQLQTFLARLPKLRHFSFSYSDTPSYDVPLDSESIVATIEQSVGATLEELSFNIENEQGNRPQRGKAIQSMKSFKKLKVLEIHFNTFFDYDTEPKIAEHRAYFFHDDYDLGDAFDLRSESDDTNARQIWSSNPNDKPVGTIYERAPLLGDILPSTIENFTLHISNILMAAKFLKPALLDIVKDGSKKLPNLKKISLRFTCRAPNSRGVPTLRERVRKLNDEQRDVIEWSCYCEKIEWDVGSGPDMRSIMADAKLGLLKRNNGGL
ncbi:hypothetical protein HYALB_00008433 [Hymenoscyphus albidus]|uniref:F-box domain-containing protein n=1 Tax=Hymenoscyphus albidus TaxID=595503 RepID=A0A9N9LJW6_9HELO|nr:hypothetical protein HYALB_00008433 [Hymenoscyphus albidus]